MGSPWLVVVSLGRVNQLVFAGTFSVLQFQFIHKETFKQLVHTLSKQKDYRALSAQMN